MKTDYSKLDAAIIATIKGAHRISFNGINARVKPEAAEIRPDGDAFRAVVRRLQALRKAGKIKHGGSFWRVIQT